MATVKISSKDDQRGEPEMPSCIEREKRSGELYSVEGEKKPRSCQKGKGGEKNSADHAAGGEKLEKEGED